MSTLGHYLQSYALTFSSVFLRLACDTGTLPTSNQFTQILSTTLYNVRTEIMVYEYYNGDYDNPVAEELVQYYTLAIGR